MLLFKRKVAKAANFWGHKDLARLPTSRELPVFIALSISRAQTVRFQDFLGRLEGVKQTGPREYKARCPAHDDTEPSLSIKEEAGKILIHCFADCSAEEIVAELNLAMPDLFTETSSEKMARFKKVMGEKTKTTKKKAGTKKRTKTKKKTAASEDVTFDYRDVDGKRLYRVVRRPDKKFKQQQPDGHGGWINNLKGVERVLYRWPELIESKKPVWFVEGERDADRLRSLGFTATTLSGGSGAPWLDSYSEVLRGRSVIVIPDNDKAGRKRAADTCEALVGVAKRVRLLEPEPPGLEDEDEDEDEGYDVSDWLDAGGSRNELVKLSKVAPEWSEDERLRLLDEPTINFVVASDVEREVVEFLQREPCVPNRKVTNVTGDPAVGKDVWSIDFAARATNGTLGGDIDKPMNVLFIAGEDGIADTFRPRLEAAGADLKRCIFYKDDGSGKPFQLPDDLVKLERFVRKHKIGLVIINPIMGYLSSKIDSHKDQSVRQALIPLAEFAERNRIAVITIQHLNKGKGSALYKGGGSIAFAGVARSVLLLAKDPDDSAFRILAPVKCNLVPDHQSIRYEIEDCSGVPRIQFVGRCDISADALVAPPNEEKRSAVNDAVEFLTEALKDGPMAEAEVMKQASVLGLATRTLNRAKSKLGVKSIKNAKRWVWQMPRSKS